MTVPNRTLGRSGLEVSAIGLGCNAIGGPYWDPAARTDLPAGYGQVDDAESIRALRRAVELGITFFDTANEYGCGHSETILGQALASCRQQVVISTKFGYTFDEAAQTVTGTCATPGYIRSACEASLRRLQTDYLDLYLFHLRDYDLERAGEVRQTLEDLVQAGKIRYYGWSTDDLARARFFAAGPHCTAIEHRLNVFLDAPEMLALCDALDLGSLNRIPLLMGVLTGKFTADTLPPDDDIRSLFFRSSAFTRDIARLESLKALLTAGGRSLAQGALAWILARHPRAVPIPGFRTVWQVEQNAAVLTQRPLPETSLQQIQAWLQGG
jgi:aryl-alcohol dehydrogenase-like predicted oxidoreductase